jgi:hypothetical protein
MIKSTFPASLYPSLQRIGERTQERQSPEGSPRRVKKYPKISRNEGIFSTSGRVLVPILQQASLQQIPEHIFKKSISSSKVSWEDQKEDFNFKFTPVLLRKNQSGIRPTELENVKETRKRSTYFKAILEQTYQTKKSSSLSSNDSHSPTSDKTSRTKFIPFKPGN